MSRHRHTADDLPNRPRPPRCLVTLEPLEVEGLSPAGQRDLAGGRGLFPARLEISRADIAQHRVDHMQRMSISGMQDKLSLRLERGRLTPVDTDGTHILKPVPLTPFRLVDDLPANEHVTMLAARRLGIHTASCGLIRMADDELAYITRRFDRTATGSRIFQEDFGALALMSADANGQNWKYDFSYEGVGQLIAKHCSAQQRDLQEFFRRVVFCFLIGNGDAHVRNFSVLRDEVGLVQLSPAYDLVNTAVHLPTDQDLGLSLLDAERGGVFSPSYEAMGFHSRQDFLDLAAAIGVRENDAQRILADLGSAEATATLTDLMQRSFLSDDARHSYRDVIEDRRSKLSRTTNS